MNTKLNPKTNKTDPRRTFPRLAENPAAKDRYPGTRGNTHGERNEITPAINAKGKAVSTNPEKI
jgi:hypothetical protein